MTREMNYALSFDDEQAMIMKSAREFCKGKSSIQDVRELLGSDTGYDKKVWKGMVELGWPGIAIPESFGGIGLGIGSLVPIAESMGRYMLATPFFSATLAAQALLRGGTQSQKEEWLPQIADGLIASVALLDSEDWGADTISCTVVEAGDRLKLSGTKWLVGDAGVAELFIVSATLQGNPALLLVNSKQLPKSAIQRHTLIDETKRAFKIDFTGVEVEKNSLLDPALSACTIRDLLLIGALLTAAEATGTAAASLDNTVEYLKTRKQFNKLIGSYQALKHPTVDILNEMEAARSHLYHAATIMGNGPLNDDMEIACRMAKAQATEALIFAGDRDVQFHGGMGFTYECDAQLHIRRAQWSQQQFGDAYHHRKRLASLFFD
jgi:alkylation response protein AidB-like acyl-CoA dehydrogenase